MQKTSDNILVLLLIGISGVFIIVVSFIIIQIRNRNKLYLQKKKLDEAEIAHQTNLLHSVIQFQEEDRKRIAQNLHDDVGGTLAVLRMLIANNEEKVAADDPQVVLIDRIIGNVRDISHTLSPQLLALLNLWEVVEDMCEHINKTGKLKIDFECAEAAKTDQWNGSTSLAIFRVIQELITNTIKHADATLINLNFDLSQNQLVIDYKDNGKGVDDVGIHDGMGMNNIISRLQMLGAGWEVHSEKNNGYHFMITLPAAMQQV